MNRKVLKFIAVLTFICLFALPSSATSRPIVKSIEIKGNKTIGVSQILSKIKTRVGQEYIESVASDDLKRLYNMGYFSDVKVDKESYEDGWKVIIYLEEKSIVDEITFSKTRYVNSRSLKSKIKTKEGQFLDNKTLRDDAKTVEEIYADKGHTMVKVKVESKIDDATNKANVHFIIREGTKVKIKKLNVFGNKHFSQKKIIRIIKTRADSLFTSGYLNEELLEEDMERIKGFYEKDGFIDANADYELSYWGDGRLEVKIKIIEGKQYFIDDVVITGNDVVTDNEIEAVVIMTKPGKVFSREKLNLEVSNIQSLYFDKGYIFARTNESTSLNPDTGKVQIRIDISEGDVAYINKVKVQGNTRTRDIVIRRELRLQPGDRFDGAKLRRSKERLRNLGYFEDINYDIEDTDKHVEKDLVVQVKETKTGTFSFGGGFSTVDKVVGFVEIEQKNFDITNWPRFTGGGQSLRIRAETGTVRNNTRVSFSEPWLFDYPVSFGFDFWRTQRDKERDVGFAYDEKRLGGGVHFGKQFTEFVSGGVSYKNEKIEVENFDSNVSADLLAEEGDNRVSVAGVTLKRDTRDSFFSPTKGWVLSGGADIAGGGLGGDKDFYRLSTQSSYYVPLKWDSVLEFRVNAGVVNAYGDSSKVPIFERFFAGGGRSIRGYDERKVGPIDPVTDDPIGGEAILVGNVEYTIPIIEFLKFATFFDVGNVWADIEDFGTDEFKAGMGVGLRIKTPIGPVSLDYGYPLNDEPGEEERTGKFYFSVSRGF